MKSREKSENWLKRLRSGFYRKHFVTLTHRTADGARRAGSPAASRREKPYNTSAMFKKILEALSTQYKGVDARILARMARKLAKTVQTEDAIDEAVQGVTLMDFIELEGDRRATAAQKSAVGNYEKRSWSSR